MMRSSLEAKPDAQAPAEPHPLLLDLIAIVGDDSVVGAADLRGLDPGVDPDNFGAGLMLLPRSTEQISTILRLCSDSGIAVVPHGGRTGLSRGATSRSGEIIISTARLNAIVELDPTARIAIVEAGVTLEQLDRAAALHGLSPGIDLGARGSATIGGMISTNAGGMEAFRYGIMRQRVLGLEVVLADGSVLGDLSRVTKVNEGYDVKQLFIGAEGTLGLVARAVLKLEPAIPHQTTALVPCPSLETALSAFARLDRAGDITLLRAEIMWNNYVEAVAADHAGLHGAGAMPQVAGAACWVLFETGTSGEAAAENFLTHLGELAEQGIICDAILAKNEAERQRFWRLREDSWAIDRKLPHGLWYDISVPHTAMAHYVANMTARVAAIDPALQVFIIGHLGDGNLHLTISKGAVVEPEVGEAVAHAVYQGLKESGGAFSAEHGIGIDKRQYLSELADPVKLRLMSGIKALLDPGNIMNPGKVV